MTAALGLSVFGNQPLLVPGSATNHVVDASNEGISWVFQSQSTEAITDIGFRYGSRTGTPPTYSIRLEGLDATGLPDNADVGGGSPTAVTFTPPADTTIDGLWQWKTLTNAYTPARGQFLAATIRYSSGTIDGSNSSSFTRSFSSYAQYSGCPYCLTNTGGTWSKNAACVVGWKTSSGRHGYIIQSVYSTNTAATAGHKALMHFTLPSGFGDTYKVRGFRGTLASGSNTTTVKAVLLQTDGTVLQDISMDSDHKATAGAAIHEVFFDESTLATLSYGTKYYIGYEVGSGTVVGMRGVQFAEAADRSCLPNGANRGLCMYDGAYTETDTVVPCLDLILDDITEPAGGGGGAGPLIGGRLVL